MSGILNSLVLDRGLYVIVKNSTRLVLCKALPATFAEAQGLHHLGWSDTVIVTGPANAPTGRLVTVQDITDGLVETTGTVTYLSVLDVPNEMILFSSTVIPKALTEGNSFTIAEFTIILPGVTA